MINQLQQTFKNEGTLLFAQKDIPLDTSEWQQLESLLASVEYEYIVGGDAGEGHSVNVCRFYNDVKKPIALHEQSHNVNKILMSEKMRKFYRQFTGTEKLCLRRCQANLLNEGDYIGVHSDQDSNPDYMATVVFHFDNNYTGGEFVTHNKEGVKKYVPTAHMALVNNCYVPHEVSRVTKGRRKTLACFLSTHFGDSKINRKDFRVVQ